MPPYFLTFLPVLAKITSKNQLTLPKSVTEPLGPVQYFDVQTQAGQIILTPVRIQRGDVLRAKLSELALDTALLESACLWAEKALSQPANAAGKMRSKPLSTSRSDQRGASSAARKNVLGAKSASNGKKGATKPLSTRPVRQSAASARMARA